MFDKVVFVTWEMLNKPEPLVILMVLFVQGTKGGFDKVVSWINNKTPDNWNIYVPTKFYAWFATFVTLVVVDLHNVSVGDAEFSKWNLVLHLFTALVFTLGTGALHSFLQEKE